MRLSPSWNIGILGGILCAALCLGAQGQTADSKDAQGVEAKGEAKGMPPRATPGDYQAQTQAGTLTIAAEFMGHAVPRPEGPLSTEDYVVVETGLFGSSGARIKLSSGDFTLRISGKNGKATVLPSKSYVLVLHSLKDPEWAPPEQAEEKKKSSTSFGTGGQSGDGGTPAPVHVPIELQRAMAQHAQKSSLPEGDRTLPVAGLMFFEYRGKTQSIHSLELVYDGPAGKATLKLQP
jgi:hypothetical protein